MAKPEVDQKLVEDHEEEDLRGTFASVLFLGAFLIVSWVGVLILYLIR